MPEANGIAERCNIIILEKGQALRIEAGLPEEFWEFAFKTDTYLRNRRPVSNRAVTPWEAWYGLRPGIKHLRVFGCPVVVHIPKEKRIAAGTGVDNTQEVIPNDDISKHDEASVVVKNYADNNSNTNQLNDSIKRRISLDSSPAPIPIDDEQNSQPQTDIESFLSDYPSNLEDNTPFATTSENNKAILLPQCKSKTAKIMEERDQRKQQRLNAEISRKEAHRAEGIANGYRCSERKGGRLYSS
ncbi:hypothetical protein K3495_g11991 [Podosphaera aphanis]|nr:hypothetical protein K3495_g11991 [Podosphaera aphanis]